MTHRFHPFQAEFHRLLEELLASPQRRGDQPPPPPTDLDRDGWTPAVDMYETAEETFVIVDVPGVDPASIDLSITGKLLTLRGQRETGDVPAATPAIQERKEGTFHRSVEVAGDVDVDAVQAEARNGVLTIRLPKRSGGKSRMIPIRPM